MKAAESTLAISDLCSMAAFVLLAVVIALVFGCSTLRYSDPVTYSTKENTVQLPVPRESFWKEFVPRLSARFFVINNLDKETGLINVSYTGDPEQFVDCGRISVDGAGGGSFSFPAARGAQDYEVSGGLVVLRASRRMHLDGRINIVVQEVGPSETKVTVNTRYVLGRRQQIVDTNGRFISSTSDSVAFNYGEIAHFPPIGRSQPVTCQSIGSLEREIILVAQEAAKPLPLVQ